jgi:hypothetical protein
MPSNLLTRQSPLARSGVFNRPARSLAGAYKSRQDRHNARAAKRWGDPDIFELPWALLWFDEVYAPVLDDDDLAVPLPPFVDIWP